MFTFPVYFLYFLPFQFCPQLRLEMRRNYYSKKYRLSLAIELLMFLICYVAQSSTGSQTKVILSYKRYSPAFLSHHLSEISHNSLLTYESPENFHPSSRKCSLIYSKVREKKIRLYSSELQPFNDITTILLDIQTHLQISQETEAHISKNIISALNAMTLTTLVDDVSASSAPSSPFPVQDIEGGSVSAEQLIVGFVAGVFPFVWAAYEFWKRIDTQQRCGVCKGSGLVSKTEQGKALKVARKCYACGGFIPWLGWKYFWFSNLNIGNGGILQRPADNYEELSANAKKQDNENS